mgnify:CR=1 FL=1
MPAASGALGIVAGGGPLPGLIAAACRAQGRPVHVVALDGHADLQALAGSPYTRVRLGAPGRALAALRAAGCTAVVLAGPVRRPGLWSLRPDWRAARVLARAGREGWGDDALLRAILTELEAEGFTVLGVQDLLGELRAPAGTWGRYTPDSAAEADIARGLAVADALGAADVGQAVVVQQGLVLGVEAAEGTDALLQRCGPLRRPGPGGVLVKRAKPGQDRRADLPTIGPETVAAAAAAGLRGLVVGAGDTLVLDLAETVARADRGGLFLAGRPPAP